ncbi:hypothetical protein GCM10027072_71390 [Streptomyces bullii]
MVAAFRLPLGSSQGSAGRAVEVRGLFRSRTSTAGAAQPDRVVAAGIRTPGRPSGAVGSRRSGDLEALPLSTLVKVP